MVLKLFEDTTQRMGLSRVPTVGERFDPSVHEAIQQQETSDHAPGTIITEVTPGYLLGKRLLRAAMVIVARRPTETKPAKEPETKGSDAKDADAGDSEAKAGDASGSGAESVGGEAPARDGSNSAATEGARP